MEKAYQIFYPVYIDSQATYKQGRRICQSDCVSSPKCEEIAEILSDMGYDVVLQEDSAYSRDFTRIGRIAFNFKKDGKATQDISSKKQLFAEVGKKIKERRIAEDIKRI